MNPLPPPPSPLEPAPPPLDNLADPIQFQKPLPPKVPLFILLGLIFLSAITFLAFRLGQQSISLSSPTPTPSTSPSPTPPPTQPPTDTPLDWKTYTNNQYVFSFLYPPNFTLKNSPAKNFIFNNETQVLNLELIQDIYAQIGQSPVIRLDVIQSTKSIDIFVEELKSKIEKSAEELKDHQNLYYQADPPIINTIQSITINNINVTKIDRYLGPGGPNAQLLEYYFASSGKVFILSASYGTYNPDVKQDGTQEKNLLPQILSTFRFLE